MKLVKIVNTKNDIYIYGSTNYKKKFKLNYTNIPLNKNILGSQSKQYINRFIKSRDQNLLI